MRLRLPFYNIRFFKTPFHLSKEMVLQGPLQVATGGRIDGVVKGDVNVEGLLVIGKGAEVKGDVYASSLEVMGSVYGNLFCSDKALVYNTAFVKGNITATVIEIKEGACVEGVIIKKAGRKAEENAVDAVLLGDPAGEEAAIEEEVIVEKSTDKDKDAITWF